MTGVRTVPAVLASSTKMISLSMTAGDVCRTLSTVLRRVDQASLWKTIITLVLGRGGQRRNFLSTHLCEKPQENAVTYLSRERG